MLGEFLDEQSGNAEAGANVDWVGPLLKHLYGEATARGLWHHDVGS